MVFLNLPGRYHSYGVLKRFENKKPRRRGRSPGFLREVRRVTYRYLSLFLLPPLVYAQEKKRLYSKNNLIVKKKRQDRKNNPFLWWSGFNHCCC